MAQPSPKQKIPTPERKLMIKPEKTLIPSRNILLSIISGCFLTIAFPPVNLSFIAWVALVPLLKALENKTLSQAFILGLLAGLVHFLSLVYWIVVVLGRYGGLNVFLSVFLCILLCFYLALYPALFSLMALSVRRSAFFILWTGCFWVGLEYIRAIFLSGFPWCLLGHTQFKCLPLIQLSDLIGVYGVSFLIVTVNAALYCLFFRDRRSSRGKTSNKHLLWEFPVIILILVGTLIYGYYRLHQIDLEVKNQEPNKFAVIQGNIDQSVKWSAGYQAKTLESYLKLTRTTYDFDPTLIVWPETAVPFFFQDNKELAQKVISIARESQSGLLFGSPAYIKKEDQFCLFNRAYLISTGVRQMQYYDKVHLVPFGEYVPLKKYLYFINRLVPAAGDFESGDRVRPMKYKDLSVGVLICFEAIFPEIARKHAQKHANILVNITNDAWFGRTGAPYQHLAMAVFRAVENRTPMIRAANTGFSAVIGPRGKIISKTDLFREAVLEETVMIPETHLTFYAQHGDFFAVFVLILALLRFILNFGKAKAGKRR